MSNADSLSKSGKILLSINAFLTALQFLTIFPPFIKRPFTQKELSHSVGFYPLVGLFLGAFLTGSYTLIMIIFPRSISLVLVLILWIVATGALHLDGFLDTCDGLFGGRNPQERLQIMRDERVGAYAFAGGVLLLLLKFTSLTNVSNVYRALLIAPLISRWAIAWAVIKFPYARREGLGYEIKSTAGNTELVIATSIAFGSSFLIATWQGLIAFFIAALSVIIIGKLSLRWIPGLTGDIYGAINELIEVTTLLIFSASIFT